MKINRIILLSIFLIVSTIGIILFAKNRKLTDDRFVTYEISLKEHELKFYFKDEKQRNFKSILNLKQWLEKKNKKLTFAMNGGMYMPDNSPQGLFIENGNLIKEIDTSSGTGNFYLKPNGIFYVTTNQEPKICRTENFKHNKNVLFATQSGPMLLIDGQIHNVFKKGSVNLNIRNGVGILPNNQVVFAMSKKEINFYDFAKYFQSLGCKNALYLDGLVSRTYLPEKNWNQVDGNFGVIIGATIDN
jgi:uncharacterized protein YigE (DUF2233 family)